MQTVLRCGSICGFNLLPKITRGLLELRGTSLLELYFFLEYGIHNDRIADVIKTDLDRELTKNVYVQFHELLLRSRRPGRVASDKLEWIIPYDHTSRPNPIAPSHDSLVRRLLRRIVERDSPSASSANTDVSEWLPWMPLSVVKYLRTWRSSRVNALHRALFKLASDIDKGTHAFYPWDRKLPSEIRQVPIQALYQYEPSSLTRGGINALRDCGLVSINDLRCLHPSGVAAAKDPAQPLFEIYRSFNSESQVTRPD